MRNSISQFFTFTTFIEYGSFKKIITLTIAAMMFMGVIAIPDAQAGAESRCKACHDLTGSKHKTGPSLAGLFGSDAGSTDFKKYSASMKKGGWVWDETNLRTYLTNTKTGIKTLTGNDGAKTKMKFKMKGKKLDDVIAYFKGHADSVVAAQPDAEELYGRHCAQCHGADRLGGNGTALLPENLSRLKQPKAADAIANGLPHTQMPAFGKVLNQKEIEAVVAYIYTPLAEMPVWGKAEIDASKVIHNAPGSLGDKPVFKADPLNLFLVVELGDHHVTVLDGDKLEPMYRFESRYALHGGPKYSPDGRFVYFASRDGWISKFDMYNLKMVVEVRAGINTRNLAISGDGRYVMVGNYLPHSLVVLDAVDLSVIKIIPVTDEKKTRTSRVSAVYQATPRNSFIVALRDLKEVWEIPYTDDTKQFPVRRIHVDDYMDDFMFDQQYRYLIGASRGGGKGRVINLDSGLIASDIDLPGMPHLGSGVTWDYKGQRVLATPNLKEGVVSVIEMKSWKTIKRINTLGPGFFMRTHENTPYAWVDVFFGPNKDAVHVIDKRTLEIVKTLRPAPGKRGGHVEFDRYGRYVLVSVWEMDGALVIYDAATLKEIKRIPMKKPSGKYNVYNKITRSAGTSH
ncbi:MAG: cytochrome D1 domain-containing protein [Gammaproteobacteria bacterium]